MCIWKQSLMDPPPIIFHKCALNLFKNKKIHNYYKPNYSLYNNYCKMYPISGIESKVTLVHPFYGI